MIVGPPRTLDDALVVVAHWGASNHTRPDPSSGRGQLLIAAELLAEYVRQHRPVMPLAQRGRTVDHAVELVTGEHGQALVSLCGGLTPDWSGAGVELVPELPAFDPSADDACRTCRRRLPVELRPPDAVPAPKPKRERRADRLAGVTIAPTTNDGVGAWTQDDELLAEWVYAVTLRKLISDVQQALSKAAAEPPD